MLTLSLLMAEVMYHLGSKLRIFSGFNIVATYFFEGFIQLKRILIYCEFDYKHFTYKINQKIITQATNVVMYGNDW